MADLEAELSLDISAANDDIDSLGENLLETLTEAVSAFQEQLASALTDATAQPLDLQIQGDQITTDIDTAITSADTPVPTEIQSDQITGDIDSAIQAADPNVETQVDGGSITSEIDSAIRGADTGVTIEADASGVTQEIDDAVTAADIAITPDVDTGGLDQLTESANEADTSVQSLSQDSNVLGNIASGAAGDISGLAGFVSNLGAGGKVAAIGLTALVSSAVLFGRQAAEAQRVEERWNLVLGASAKQIAQVNFGGVNQSLKSLSLELGFNLEKTQSAATGFFAIAKNAGLTGPALNNVTKEALALSIRTFALSGGQKDVATSLEAMSSGLARQKGQVQILGKSYTDLQTRTEAAALFNKKASDTFTVTEKSIANMSLRSKEVGKSFKDDLAFGAQLSTIKMAALKEQIRQTNVEAGKASLSGFTGALKSAQPIFLALTQTLGTLVSSVLPLFSAGFKVVSGAAIAVGAAIAPLAFVIETLGEGLNSIPAPILQIVGGLLALKFAVGPLVSLLAGYGKSLALATLESIQFGIAQVAVGVAAGGAAGWITALGGAINVAIPIIGAITLGIGLVTGIMHLFGGSTDEQKKKTSELAQKLLESKDSFDSVFDSMTKTRLEAKHQTDDIAKLGLTYSQFTDLVNQGTKGQAILGEAMVKTGQSVAILKDDTVVTANNFDKYAGKLDKAAKAGQDVFDGNQGLRDSFKALAKQEQDSAQQAIFIAEASGVLAKDQGDAAIAVNTSKDGHVNYRLALLQLEPTIRAAQAAQEAKTKTDQDALFAAQPLAAIALQIADAYQQTLAPTDKANENFIKLKKGSASLSLELLAGKGSQEDYARAISGTKLSMDDLSPIIDDIKGRIDSLSQSWSKGVDAIAIAADSIKDGTGLADFFTNLDAANAKTEQFFTDLQVIRQRGGENFAVFLAEQGLTASTMTHQLATENDKQFQDSVKHFNDDKALNDKRLAALKVWAAQYVAEKLGLLNQDQSIEVLSVIGKERWSAADQKLYTDWVARLKASKQPVSQHTQALIDAYLHALQSGDPKAIAEAKNNLFNEGLKTDVPKKPKESGKKVGEAAHKGLEEGSDGAKAVGASIVAGLQAGLAVPKSLLDTARSLAQAALNAMHAVINNPPFPSREGINIGFSIVAGITEGLKDTTELERQATAVATLITDTIGNTTTGVSVVGSTPTQVPAFNIGGTTQATAAGAMMKKETNFTFNAKTVDVDAKEVMELSRRAELLVPSR